MHVVWHPSSLEHDPGEGHPESPARLRAVLNSLRTDQFAGHVKWHEVDSVNLGAILAVHSEEYYSRLDTIAAAGGGWLDQDTYVGAGSLEAAIHAAGAAVQATALSVQSGRNSFAAVRPPGHHACYERGMGFCLLNNVVVAARFAINHFDLDRILIVDWDVHHGNGTQELVEADNRIRYVSLHEWPAYPGTGAVAERGVGNVFNVPLPGGLPRRDYVEALGSAVDRATNDWLPQLIIISAGFDAMAGDPLANFTLEPMDYSEWISRWMEWGVPMVSVLEGGYVPDRLAVAVEEHIRALSSDGSVAAKTY